MEAGEIEWGQSDREILKGASVDRTIRTYKASPIRPDAETPALTIIFDQEIPAFEGLKGLEESSKAYCTAAKEIVEAMGKSLPGGLYDAILVEMMRGKISLFRVPHFTEEG